MIDQNVIDYYEDLRNRVEVLTGTDNPFAGQAFVEIIANELEESGEIDGLDPCHLKKPGIRADGYYFDDEHSRLDVFVTDHSQRSELASIQFRSIKAEFNKARRLVLDARNPGFSQKMEPSSPEYDLARGIADRNDDLRRVRLLLLSERYVEPGTQRRINEHKQNGITFAYDVWDIGRLFRLEESPDGQELLDVDLEELFKQGIPCLDAGLGQGAVSSYLAAVPGNILAGLYDRYGSRLLEQNVRSYLQARGAVNKGILSTIRKEPNRFFAYNNGITATARSIVTEDKTRGLFITRIKGFQIVNGGQTTASLWRASQDNPAPDLEDVYVQMKLSRVTEEDTSDLVANIAKFSNTQNRIRVDDLASNHPFHIRMEEHSRHTWAPQRAGDLTPTKWFYERARGQWSEAQAKLSSTQRKRYKRVHPTSQKFSKTDLAKYENVWDEQAHVVQLGAQKNFAQFMERISKEWDADPDKFDRQYFQRVVARAILFKSTERMVSRQEWYGGYRANIVGYTLSITAALGNKKKGKTKDAEATRVHSPGRNRALGRQRGKTLGGAGYRVQRTGLKAAFGPQIGKNLAAGASRVHSPGRIGKLDKQRGKTFDYERVWRQQEIEGSLMDELAKIALSVRNHLEWPERPVKNVTEWAKRPQLWENRIEPDLPMIENRLTRDFWEYFV